MRLFGRLWILLFVLSVGLPASAFAQTGSVSGRVTDAAGRPLNGASVFVMGTGYSDVTDALGGYRINGLPAGAQTLTVRSLGYAVTEQPITISAGQTASVDFRLEVQAIELDEISVQGQREGQARALNLQRTADNIQNIVASDFIGRFPDPNSAEAIQRLPGVAVQRDQGEGRFVLVRGTEPRLSAVSINGQRVPAPEGDVRFVALDVIPSDQLAAIEVSKTLTPDQDADAIGGSVNLVTKAATQPGLAVDFTGAGGLNDLTEDEILQFGGTIASRSGPDNRLGLLLSGSYYKTNRGSDNIEQEFTDDFGGVTEEVDLRDYAVARERLGVNAALDYDLGAGSRLWVRGMFNDFSDQEFRRRSTIGFGDLLSATSSEDGKIERELKDRLETQQIWHASAGGDHSLGGLNLDYSVSYSYAEEDEPDRSDIVFVQEDLLFNIDSSDLSRPGYSIAGGSGSEFDNGAYEFDELVVENNLTTDEELSAAVNLGLPYTVGSFVGELKFGGKVRSRTKDRINDIQVFDGFDAGDLTLDQFAGTVEDMGFFNGLYRVGQVPDPTSIRDFVGSNISQFEEDTDASREDSDPATYTADETVLAGYLMTTLDSGPLRLIPGVRFERTDVDYTANEVIFNEDGDYDSTVPLTGTNDYTDIFPSLNAILRVSEQTNIRGAIGTSISRPNFGDVVPFRFVNREDDELESGNATLDPTRSLNLDLLFETYFQSIGVFSAGVFYKDLKDYIFFRTTDVESGTFAGFESVQPENAASGTLYGFEVAWTQQLSFLPGVLNGLGLYANYTWTDADVELPDRAGDTVLPGQAQSLFNGALSYEKGRLSGRIALNYHDEYILEVGDDANEDEYVGAHTQLDASASFQVHPRVRIFAEAINLTDEPYVVFQGSSDRPIQQEFYSWWAHAGLKISFR